MPIYEYKCKVCGKEFEVLVLSDKEPVHCPACGSKEVERMISAFSTMGLSAGASCGSGGFS